MGFADIARRHARDLVPADSSRPRTRSLVRQSVRVAYRALGRRPAGSGPQLAEPVSAGLLERAGDPVIVASHRRSGTHLTIDLLRRQFGECSAWKWPGEGLDSLYTNLDRLGRHRDPLTPARLEALLSRAAHPILKTHATPDFSELRAVQGAFVDQLVARAKIIYVVRDGRAVMVSAQRHEERLGLDVGRDLLDYMQLEQAGRSRARAWAEHVEHWLSVEGALLVRYEDVVRRGAEVVQRIGNFLGLEPAWVQPIVPPLIRSQWGKRAMRFTHLRPPTTALTPPTAPRPWRDLFGPEEEAWFDSQAGGVMRKLGYVSEAETSPWDDLAPLRSMGSGSGPGATLGAKR